MLPDSPEQTSESTLPEPLERKLHALKKGLRLRTLQEWALLSVTVLLLILLLFILWDRNIPTTTTGRSCALLLGGLGLTILGPLRWVTRVNRYQKRSQLSHLIKRAYPRFGDRLQGALELRHQDSHQTHYSPALKRAAIEQISQEAEQINFQKALPTDSRKALLILLIPLISTLALLLTFQPKQTKNATSRFFLPLSSLARYTVIRFINLPKTLHLPKDEPYQLTIALKDVHLLASIPPASLKLPGRPTLTSIYDSGYHFHLPPLTKNTSFTIKAGDAYKNVRLTLESRPRLKTVHTTTHYPDYLQLPPRRTKTDSATIPVLADSKVELELQATKPLSQITTSPPISFSLEKNQARSPQLHANELETLQVLIKDKYAIETAPPFTLQFQHYKDTPPKASIHAPSSHTKKELILLPHETLELQLRGRDDFGVSMLGLRWEEVDGDGTYREKLVEIGQPTATTLHTTFAFNPEVLDLPPATYTVASTAKDYQPKRTSTTSSPILIHILSLEAHAEHLRATLDKLLDTLDEHYQEELKLYFENQRLEPLITQSPQNPTELKKRLKTALEKETKHTLELTAHQKSAYHLQQESFRNPQLHHSHKLSFVQLSQELIALTQRDLPALHHTLTQASSASKYNTHLQSALSQQLAALNKLKHAIAQARKTAESFKASTFANRLSQLSKQENSFAKSIWNKFNKTAGLTETKLDPADRHENEALGTKQKSFSDTLQWITEDLRNYGIRVEKPAYETLADDISSSSIFEEMMAVNDSLTNNHRHLASTACLHIAQKIAGWAAETTQEQHTSSSPTGGGGNSRSTPNSSGEQDTEFMLQLMEIIRAQQNLRGRTRALEQEKRLATYEPK